jgi:hypothetical protein
VRLDLLDCLHVYERADHGTRVGPVGDLHRAGRLGGAKAEFRRRGCTRVDT